MYTNDFYSISILILQLFGAFCSSSIRDCHHYYGTGVYTQYFLMYTLSHSICIHAFTIGESFVFTFNKQYSKTKLLSKSQPLPHPSLRQVHFDPQLLLTTEVSLVSTIYIYIYTEVSLVIS